MNSSNREFFCEQLALVPKLRKPFLWLVGRLRMPSILSGYSTFWIVWKFLKCALTWIFENLPFCKPPVAFSPFCIWVVLYFYGNWSKTHCLSFISNVGSIPKLEYNLIITHNRFAIVFHSKCNFKRIEKFGMLASRSQLNLLLILSRFI